MGTNVSIYKPKDSVIDRLIHGKYVDEEELRDKDEIYCWSSNPCIRDYLIRKRILTRKDFCKPRLLTVRVLREFLIVIDEVLEKKDFDAMFKAFPSLQYGKRSSLMEKVCYQELIRIREKMAKAISNFGDSENLVVLEY